MQTTRSNTSEFIRKLALCAVFCALAFASMFFMRINVVFLTFDFKDAIVTIVGLLLGPIYALASSLCVAFLEFITVGDTGFWGFIMDFLSTASFSCVCALNYKNMKNLRGAAIGLSAAVISMTVTMLLFNLFILPLYNPTQTIQSVMAIIPSLLLPFNLTKGVLNAAIVLILYKPISTALKATGILQKGKKSSEEGNNKKKFILSLAVTAIGILLVVACLMVFFYFLNGEFSLVEI